METKQLTQIVLQALEDTKAKDVVTMDVSNLTTITDVMIICSGTSNRHIKSLADNVIKSSKENGARVLGIEGETQGEWVLVDLGDVVVHLMLPATRDFYQLEKLWGFNPANLSYEN